MEQQEPRRQYVLNLPEICEQIKIDNVFMETLKQHSNSEFIEAVMKFKDDMAKKVFIFLEFTKERSTCQEMVNILKECGQTVAAKLLDDYNTSPPFIEYTTEIDLEVTQAAVMRSGGSKLFNMDKTPRGITGGRPVSPREGSWMARLNITSIHAIGFEWSSHVCSGTIINDRWILTAAHCLWFYYPENPYPWFLTEIEIEMGIQDSRDNETSRVKLYSHASDVVFHIGYNRSTHLNDIAFIKLPHDLDFNGNHSHLSPIELDNNKYDVDVNNCYAFGWGQAVNEYLNDQLREVRLPILNDTQCESSGDELHLYKAESMICAGSERFNTCYGDAGGPLVCPLKNDSNHWIQYGVTTFYSACYNGTKSSPSLFAKVSHYSDGIKESISKSRG